jgi:hypothetical protein
LKPRARLRLTADAFIGISSVFLMVSASLKLWALISVGGGAVANPLLSVPDSLVLSAAAFAELFVALRGIFCRGQRLLKLASIAYLGGVFCAYRAALRGIGFSGSCGCLGPLGTWLGAPGAEGVVLSGSAVAMLMGGLTLLLFAPEDGDAQR